MEELTKRNGKGAWSREIEKVLKRFGATLEWQIGVINTREEEIEMIGRNGEMEECEKKEELRVNGIKSIEDSLEDI